MRKKPDERRYSNNGTLLNAIEIRRTDKAKGELLKRYQFVKEKVKEKTVDKPVPLLPSTNEVKEDG